MHLALPPRAASRSTIFAALAVLTCVVGTASSARAQAPWDATLFVAPFPSPYLSDWQINPTVATLTILNGGSSAQDVILRYDVRNQAGVVVTTGYSDPQTIAAGIPVVYSDLSEIAGTQEHDPGLEDQVVRTGRLPEGDYTACVAVTDLGGFVLAQDCAEFTIIYPDPPMLIAPASDDVVLSAAPIFQWTPLQVPSDYTLRYVLQIAEVLPNQLPEAALSSNILWYENDDVGTTSLPYPLDALPLESGKTYAWRVIAMDQNGYAASANDGSSEIWTFTYDDGAGGGGEIPASSPITLTLRNDPDDPSVTAPEDDPTTGLLQICSEWDLDQPVEAVSLPLASRILFPKSVTVPAGLVRKVNGNHRVWAILGARDPWSFVAYGDCDGPLDRTVLRWIGARRTSDAQELWGWLAGAASGDDSPAIPEDTPGATLKFGVGIFSLYEMTATGDSLEPVRQFLEDNEVEVQPGFNFYGIVDGNQSPILKTIADRLHTTTADFEIQGFAGFNNQVNAGVSIGRTDAGESGLAGDVGTAFVILELTGTLPAWEHPGWDWVQSLQLGLDVVVQDSLAYGVGARDAGSASSLEIVPAVTLTLVTSDDVTFTGTVGLDFAKNKGEAFNPHLVVKLNSDAKWRPGRLRGMDVYIGNPEIELDVEDWPEWSSLKQNGFGALEWSLGVNGSLGWGNEEAIAKLGVTFGRKADEPGEYWGDLVSKDSALAKSDTLLIERSRDGLRQAEERGDTAAAEAFQTQLAEREARLANTLRSLRADAAALDQWKKAEAQGVSKPNAGEKKGAWWWKARLGFGNMSLLDLVDLVRKAMRGGS